MVQEGAGGGCIYRGKESARDVSGPVREWPQVLFLVLERHSVAFGSELKARKSREVVRFSVFWQTPPVTLSRRISTACRAIESKNRFSAVLRTGYDDPGDWRQLFLRPTTIILEV